MSHELAGAMALALAAGALLPAVPAGAYDYEQCAREGQCRIASDAELDRLRGGFSIDTAVGRLEIAIGITRAISVNEQLVAVSQLVLPDANQIAAAARAQAEAAKTSGLAAGQASSLGAAAAAAALAQASASASLGGAGAAGSSTPPQVVVNGVPLTPDAPIAAALNRMGGVVVVQNGPGNGVNLSELPVASAMTTIIQNSLDNQVISSLTLINASVNSLAALRGLALGDLLSRATLSSGR